MLRFGVLNVFQIRYPIDPQAEPCCIEVHCAGGMRKRPAMRILQGQSFEVFFSLGEAVRMETTWSKSTLQVSLPSRLPNFALNRLGGDQCEA